MSARADQCLSSLGWHGSKQPVSYHIANKPRIIAQVHKHELRLRMDAAIGRAPPITDAEIQVWLGVEGVRCYNACYLIFIERLLRAGCPL